MIELLELRVKETLTCTGPARVHRQSPISFSQSARRILQPRQVTGLTIGRYHRHSVMLMLTGGSWLAGHIAGEKDADRSKRC